MLRLLDVVFSLAGLILLFPVFVLLLVIGFWETRSPLFRQVRMGAQQRPFVLVKFRTMAPGTDSVATHLVGADSVTPFGRFLRKTKLDELPQLWNVLKGDMSLVGPRPCLPSQSELIEERASKGVFAVRPGITGLAQVRGIDMSTPRLLAETDQSMISRLGPGLYLRLILYTALGQGAGDRIVR